MYFHFMKIQFMFFSNRKGFEITQKITSEIMLTKTNL